MHHRSIRAVLALVAVTVLVGSTTPAFGNELAADPTCSTYQYWVTEHATVRWSPGGTVAGHVYSGWKANIHAFSDNGWWYWGDYYDRDTVRRYSDKWIERAHLSYIKCW